MPSELDLTAANILRYAKKYSFYPLDKPAGYISAGETMLTGDYAGFRHTVVDDSQKISTIQVDKNTDPLRNRGAAFVVLPSLLGSATGTFAYFLPWDPRGAAVEMTIPRLTSSHQLHTNPELFFTAVLSGCSILFKGSAEKPTIFHCGTEGGEAGANTVGNSNVFFRRMLRDIKSKNLGRSKKALAAQVNSSDYMIAKSGPGPAELHATQFENMLKGHYDRRLAIQNVSMWGCLFGFRVGSQWEFHLQENATIIFYKLSDILDHFVPKAMAAGAKSFDLEDLTEQQIFAANLKQQVRARPAVVTQVFPGGAAMATITSKWKTIDI